jgi:hypothetical protein
VKKFLIEQGFGVTLLDRSPTGEPASMSMSPWMVLIIVLFGTLVLGVGLGAGWVLLLER